jgi:hypothetical protein
MVETTIIRISKENHKRFIEIQKSRPQDSNNAQTFDYILRVFEESPLRIEICKEITRPRNIIAGNASSPIIDADNLRIVTPTTMAEKLYSTKLKQDALKAANATPIKNMSYQESKE